MALSIEDYLYKDIFLKIYNIANSAGDRVYVVGEFVRDYYLSRKSNRIEIVVEGDAIEFGRKVGMNIKTNVSYFKNQGVATINYQGDEIVFSGAKRRIINTGGGKPTYAPGRIQDDLLLRDFTINALAISLNSSDYGEMIDISKGLEDISKGIIRTPLQPEEVFRSNPLMMLRAIRLATQLSRYDRKFQIDPDCKDAIRKYADKVDSIPKERVSEELNKILLCNVPRPGIKLLDECGILQRIIPALAATKGVETVDGIAHADSFPHSLMVLDNVAKLEAGQFADTTNSLGIKQGEPNLWLRWAALLHEIGKPQTKRFVRGKGWTFNGYDVVGAKMIRNVFSSLKLPMNEKMKYVQKLISLQNRPKMLMDEDTSESAFRRLLFDAGDDIMDLILLCQANVTTINITKANREHNEIERVKQQLLLVKDKDAVRNFKNPISANYIMDLFGLKPSNTLGKLKDSIKKAILDGEIGNTFEEADALLRKIAAGMGLTIKNGDTSVQDPAEGVSAEESSVESPVEHEDNEIEAETDIPNGGANPETKSEEPPTESQLSPLEEESPASVSPSPQVDYSEIMGAFNDNGISRLYLITNEEEFNSIQDGQFIVKDSFTLLTHNISKEGRKEPFIALEIDLQVLTLPGTIITFEALLSQGITYGTEVSNIRAIEPLEGFDLFAPQCKGNQSLIATCVIIVRDRIPVNYIVNFEAMREEYSSSLPF